MPQAPPRLGSGPRRKRATPVLIDQRESAARRGYGRAWQKASKAFLRKHPLCECDDCKAGVLRVRASTVVDHIIPHRGDMKLFWDRSNWQAMSGPCHSRKTAREDGGFGNPMA
jgi:5-methylcytosine-specific restriction enzyme A